VSRYTKLTELMTGVGMLGGPDPSELLPLPAPELTGVDQATWAAVVAQSTEPDAAPVAAASLENGRYFLHARDALRGRRPLRIEWKGPHRTPGDEVAPVDLRVDHVYLVSCKYLSDITVNASPSHLFDRLLTGGHGHRAGDWYEEVAPAEHRSLFRQALAHLGRSSAVVLPSELPQPERKAIAKQLVGRSWPGQMAAGYEALVAATSAESARRWRAALDRAGTGAGESMLWRLLRIGSAPYFVLGSNRGDSVRMRVGSPWDWRQAFALRAFEVRPALTGQPRVDWSARYLDRASGCEREVRGHVEIRWSHGRFSGPPEAKVYLDTPHAEVPGYFPLR
jgi:hypothetical protein